MTTIMRSAGPMIGVASDPEIDAGYESVGLEAIRPHYIPYEAPIKALPALKVFPDVATISVNMPENAQILHEIPTQLDPAYFFESFVKGCAVVAQIVPAQYVEAIKVALRDEVATLLSNGEGLPGIDTDFAESYRRCEIAILRNGEMISWGNLLAFAYGAYWLLSYVQAPRRKRGSMTPLEFVESVILFWGGLCHLPQE